MPAATTITVSTGTLAAANYSFLYVNGTLTITQASPTIAVGTSGSPSNYGSPVTFTATVPAGDTNLVTFYSGATVLGTATPSNGAAMLTTSSLAPGSYVITASIAAGGNFTNASTTSGITQTVNQASSSITTNPTASAITYGQALSASTLNGGVGSPTGGTFSWTTPTTIPLAGTPSESITYTPTNTIRIRHGDRIDLGDCQQGHANGDSGFFSQPVHLWNQRYFHGLAGCGGRRSASDRNGDLQEWGNDTLQRGLAQRRIGDLRDHGAGCSIRLDHRGLQRRLELQHSHFEHSDADGEPGQFEHHYQSDGQRDHLRAGAVGVDSERRGGIADGRHVLLDHADDDSPGGHSDRRASLTRPATLPTTARRPDRSR